MPIRHLVLAVAVVGGLVMGGCGAAGDAEGESATTAGTTGDTTSDATQTSPTGPTESGAADPDAQRHPDVIDADVSASGDGWTVAATISSPYDTPERYADAFRVLAPDGTELGIRELAHDHANEQPFTRSTGEISIPDDVDEVTVEGRDQANGWGGDTVTVAVPR